MILPLLVCGGFDLMRGDSVSDDSVIRVLVISLNPMSDVSIMNNEAEIIPQGKIWTTFIWISL